jgi:hypothetical protein
MSLLAGIRNSDELRNCRKIAALKELEILSSGHPASGWRTPYVSSDTCRNIPFHCPPPWSPIPSKVAGTLRVPSARSLIAKRV